jgi:ribosomal protein L18E
LNSKINITATSFSTTAKQKIEKAGGTAIEL